MDKINFFNLPLFDNAFSKEGVVLHEAVRVSLIPAIKDEEQLR